jgi:hypothetical protein
MMVPLITTIVLALAGDGVPAAQALETWCIECHQGVKPKGKFNLQGVFERLTASQSTAADRSLLRKALRRLADSEMPPPDAEHIPNAQERALSAQALRSAIAGVNRVIVPKSAPPRRLNRAEYANTIRDLFGIDVSEFSSLPPDDVGAGFDNVGAVLSLAPTALEKYFELAEVISARACPESTASVPAAITINGKAMTVTERAGQVLEDGALLWSSGEARCTVQLPRAGTYAISIRAGGDQVGPEPVRMGVLAGKKRIADFTVTEDKRSPGEHRMERMLKEGEQSIAITFDNDYYNKDAAVGTTADRNAFILSMTIEGPLEPFRAQAWRSSMEAFAASANGMNAPLAEQHWLIERILRRPATDTDCILLNSIVQSLPDGSSKETKMRAMIEALLVHPEFLFRIEDRDESAGPELAPHTLATRLAYFLWASCPDEALASAATRGELSSSSGRAAAVDRLLMDPRSSSLAERFATQWLAIDGLGNKMPDASQFPDVNAALLRSMRTETVMFFESVLREHRSAETLIDADYTFIDARLAKHYGMAVPVSDGMHRVRIDPQRGGGILAHASVLTATSNPTRTSPVKRGKWVLQALLDAAPPPPPPGTAQIPDRIEDRAGKSIRELMEIHRADPNCAACHRSMDELGFAFEAFDPVGSLRDRADGIAVNATGTLPDGSVLQGVNGVRAKLKGNAGFTRSLVEHLMVYATGCAQEDSSDDELDELMESLASNPTLSDIVHAIVESPSFRLRGVQ